MYVKQFIIFFYTRRIFKSHFNVYHLREILSISRDTERLIHLKKKKPAITLVQVPAHESI